MQTTAKHTRLQFPFTPPITLQPDRHTVKRVQQRPPQPFTPYWVPARRFLGVFVRGVFERLFQRRRKTLEPLCDLCGTDGKVLGAGCFGAVIFVGLKIRVHVQQRLRKGTVQCFQGSIDGRSTVGAFV